MDLPGPVVFFDGDCPLCHWSVRLVARHDRAARFHFAPLGGETAARVLAGTGLSGPAPFSALSGSAASSTMSGTAAPSTRSGAGVSGTGAADSVPPAAAGTVVLVDASGVWTRSSAVLRLAHALGGGWRIVALLAGLVPRPIRDAAYVVVARLRYRMFGRTTCELLPREVRARLLP